MWCMKMMTLYIFHTLVLTLSSVVLLGKPLAASTTTNPASTFNCTFDIDPCGWTQAQDDDFDWERKKGMSSNANTGPAHDHTKNNGGGYYMFTNSRYYLTNQKARLVSPTFTATPRGNKCFQFFYLMHGTAVGTLTIYLSTNGNLLPLWTRSKTQGIFYLKGQVSLNTTAQVVIEGTGSSGNDGDIAIDDVSLSDGPCSSTSALGSVQSMACDFELQDMCGYKNMQGNTADWVLTHGTMTHDHTTDTNLGGYMSIQGQHKGGFIQSPYVSASGTYCLTFFYMEDAMNEGSLSVSLLNDQTNFNTFLWKEDGGQLPGLGWNKVMVTMNISGTVQLTFSAIIANESGGISIDDISVRNGSCETPPNCDFDNLDMCSWSNDIYDNFNWEIAAPDNDAQVLAPWRDADGNTNGAFILLHMKNNNDGGLAFLVSEVITVKGVQCFEFYYYPMKGSSNFFAAWLTIYVADWTDFPGISYWTMHMTNSTNGFVHGRLPLQMSENYKIRIGGYVSSGSSLSLDKISLSANNCTYLPANAVPGQVSIDTTTAATTVTSPHISTITELPSQWDCDFEKDWCHWKNVNDSMTNSAWIRRQPGPYLNGPVSDHTLKQDFQGYYLTVDKGTAKLQTDISLKANTNYCLNFWINLYAFVDFEFTVQTLSSSPVIVLYKDDSLDVEWHLMTVNLPANPSSFNIQFIYEQMSADFFTNQIALDDVHIYEGQCNLLGGPNCTFDQGLCDWTNSDLNDFNFTLSTGTDQNSTMIINDHTTEAAYGSFIKATADGHSQGQKSHFISSKLTFNTSVCLRFFYYVTPLCDSDISIQTFGPQDRHYILLLDFQDIVYGTWQLIEVTVYDPENIQIIFTVAVGHNKSGAVGFDDITFIEHECSHIGSTGFENGFDAFHNVYSNDLNWIIASPSGSIFPWLPEKDFSADSPQGHFAVATYNKSDSAGKKAELWSQLYPPSVYQCTSFSLYVTGKDPGTLNVTVLDYLEETRTIIWSYTPDTSKGDSLINARFPHVYSSKFYIVFTVIMGADGGWALDKIETDPSFFLMCGVEPAAAAASTVAMPTDSAPSTTAPFVHTSVGECDFEVDLCNWHLTEESYFDWNRTSGDPTIQFSPKSGRPGGKIYYLALPRSASPESALLRSPRLNNVPPDNTNQVQLTLRFWLYMAGEHIGQFFVQLDTTHESNTFYYRDWATNSWEQIEISASVTGPFTLTIEGRRGSYDLDATCVDDIELSFSAVEDDDTVYKCTFESSDLCGFQQDTTDDLNWEWYGGEDGGITDDHTTLQDLGHAIVMSQLEGNPGDIARLISKSVPPMSGCLTFWLKMGSDGNALRVYISGGGQEELILQRQDFQGRDWIKIDAPVTSNVPFTIILEDEILSDRRGAPLEVDDLSLSNGECDAHGACSFERDMCTWQNAVREGDDFDWIWGTGSSVGEMGPPVDNTLGSPYGHYMYIDSSGPFHYQDKAWLESDVFPKGIQCLHFHYFMRGFSVGTLSVYTVTTDFASFTIAWSLSGDQGSSWKSAMVVVGTNLLSYRVRLEGALGYSVTSDIAIDDIAFMAGACEIQPPEAKVLLISSTTQISTVPQQNTKTAIVECNFDNVTLCGFKNGISNNTWVMSDSNMQTSDTLKPFNGHTSDNTNGFIYAKVGAGLSEGATAQIISPSYSVGNGEPKCLEFYYHMNGDQVGQLNVYIAPDTQENALTTRMRVWSKNFDAGPGWKRAHVPILQSSNYHVVFEAIRSKYDYYYGIDDLAIFDNECEPSDSCDFEEDICLWSNDGSETSSNFYWQRYQGVARTARLAPVVDHTHQTITGYYMFVESSVADTGSVARLYSQVFAGQPDSPYCFHFWYYLFGNNVGQLRVLVRNSISSNSFYSDANLWELDSETGDKWNLAQVNISQVYTQKPFMIILEAAVGSTLSGVFAVDDTHFEISDCETQPPAAVVTANALLSADCNFDDGDTCYWTSVNNEKYKFIVNASGGAIPNDHTSGGGRFLLASSMTIPQNTSVVIQSPLLPPTFGTSCFTFYYSMQMARMSDLLLTLLTGGNELVLWKAYPEKNNAWISVSINIQSNYDYTLYLTATVGIRDAGNVAVDDISLMNGPCQRTSKITFERGLGGFIPTAASNINWMSAMASDTFIQTDQSFHVQQGHVALANLGNTTAEFKTAELQSPLYPSAGDECMEFWYAKRGSTGGWLSVKILETRPGFSNANLASLWMTTADTNGQWKRAMVDIASEYTYWIIFQAAANNSQVNDVMVIDDISFRPDPCPSPVTCDFDLTTCDYVSPRNGSVYWQIHKGVYSTSLMPFDQTLQSDQGMYMEVDFPSSGGNYTSRLISSVEEQISNKCLNFWYYGSGEGTLQVFTQNNVSQQHHLLVTKTVLTNMTVPRIYHGWKNVQVDVNNTAPYSVVFEASNQEPRTSFAIDSITLVNGSCAGLIKAQTAHAMLDPKMAMLGCDFENSDFCNFTDNKRGFNWKLFSFDSKHTAGTGVNFDHTKFNKYGHHAYMDVSGQKYNSTAQLISPTFISDRFICLSFYYAMYGRDVNQLNVYVVQGQTKKLYWTRSENQGETWHHQMVEIGGSPQPTQIMFEGVVGSSNQGDIDLDDIWIFHGNCPPPEFCDFEDSEMCKMDQDNLDNTEWILQSAALSNGTDPMTDHTYRTKQGHYLIMNMAKTKTNNVARIFTKKYNTDSARCLSFWFHFSNPPNNTHVLTIKLQNEIGTATTLIVLRGDFKDDWTPAILPLNPTSDIQVIFQGMSVGSIGSIALDDIKISPDECESYINCDFESQDMCGWKPVPDYSTPPWEVIPPNQYMVLNFSYLPSKDIQVSKVQSLIIPPGIGGQSCLSFNFKMYGNNVGFLNISMEVEYPVPQTILLTSFYQFVDTEKWHFAAAVTPQVDIGIARYVISGTTAGKSNISDTAVILIDGIQLIQQSCEDWESQNDVMFKCNNGQPMVMYMICDFMPDCSEAEDEKNCGACDFENDYCKWEDDSTGSQEFIVVGGIPNRVFTNSHPGRFLTLQRADGIPGGTADLILNQELGPSPYNCTMDFSYYMSVDSQSRYGSLFVSIEENHELTILWESSNINSTNWQTASVDIGSIHSRFKIHFTSRYLPFDNAMGIDDIKFSGCTFEDTQSSNCSTQYVCNRNGACIDSTDKLCDFTDECGDGSDEDPSICAEYLMDNFEESLGDWSQDDQDNFDWSRHSGNWISSSSGPRRDHTLGTNLGHYLIFEGGIHINGQVARLVSPEFLPTQSSNCKIRYFYHMHGSDKGQLTMYVRLKTSGQMQQICQHFTTLNDKWLFDSCSLISNDSFQVVFEGKVIGQHSTDIGLDDVTFTPQCQLKNPSTNRPGTPKSLTTAKSGGTITTAKPDVNTAANSVTTRKPPTQASYTESESSDSWKVPVGVVLGLIAFFSVIAGIVVYIIKTRRLTSIRLPLIRRGIGTSSDDTHPVFHDEASENTPSQISELDQENEGFSEILNKKTESVPGDIHLIVSNPLYTDASQSAQHNSSEI